MIIYFKIEDEFAIKHLHYELYVCDSNSMYRDGAFSNSVADAEVIKKFLNSDVIVTVWY